jgi:hypothetical protein
MPGPQDPRGSEMQAPGAGPRIDPGTDHSFSLIYLSTHISARATSYKVQVWVKQFSIRGLKKH